MQECTACMTAWACWHVYDRSTWFCCHLWWFTTLASHKQTCSLHTRVSTHAFMTLCQSSECTWRESRRTNTWTNALFKFYFFPADLPKMLVICNYHGIPSPLNGPPLNINAGDIIELIEANVHSSWWKVRQFYTLLINFSSQTALQEQLKHVFSC